VYRHDFNRVWRKVNRFGGADLFDVLVENPGTQRNQLLTQILRGETDSSTPQDTLFIGPNERDFVSQGVESRLRCDVVTGPIAHRMEYGLRLHNDRIERRHSEEGFLILAGEPTPTQRTNVTTFNEGYAYALAGHFADAMTWDAFTLTPGARVEVIRSGLDDRATGDSGAQWTYAFVPGIGAYYAITKDFGLLAGVYRGFSPPAPSLVDENVDPERSLNYEAGARFSRGPARAELIGFYNDYSNLTDQCTFSSGCSDAQLDQQFDAGEARIYGFEAFADYEIRLPAALKAPVTVAYTLTQAEFLNTFSSEDPIFGDVEEGDEMPYVPQHQLSASAGLEHRRAGGALSVTYVAAMREEAGSEPLETSLATDELLTIDVALYYRASSPIELYLVVRNLLDDQKIVSRRPFGARPNAPRWIEVGVKAEL
jgi:Fe(3+) dicitrate transport protein